MQDTGHVGILSTEAGCTQVSHNAPGQRLRLQVISGQHTHAVVELGGHHSDVAHETPAEQRQHQRPHPHHHSFVHPTIAAHRLVQKLHDLLTALLREGPTRRCSHHSVHPHSCSGGSTVRWLGIRRCRTSNMQCRVRDGHISGGCGWGGSGEVRDGHISGGWGWGGGACLHRCLLIAHPSLGGSVVGAITHPFCPAQLEPRVRNDPGCSTVRWAGCLAQCSWQPAG